MSEKDFLMDIYTNCGGPGWKYKTNWGSNLPLDQWYGVRINDKGKVVELGLYRNRLSGTIPASMGQLLSLETLYLNWNNLTGGWENLVKLPCLTTIDVDLIKLLNLPLDLKDLSLQDKLTYARARIESGGECDVKRIRLLLVGNGAAGKTALVRALLGQDFDDKLTFTDGIHMSSLLINGVQFTVMDFAGQKEYFHTHTLFFKNDALFLLVYNPRIENSFDTLATFIQMIKDNAPTAPILLITTHCDENVLLSDLNFQHLQSFSKNLLELIPVDSKSGTGISHLRYKLVEISLQQPRTVQRIPNSFFLLQQLFQRFTSQGRFSLSDTEVKRLAVSELKMDNNSLDLALELFTLWGLVYRLSNDAVVIQPQMLADVLACVFTRLSGTLERIQDASQGLLRHQRDTLAAVWGHFEESLWCFEVGNPEEPPFLQLLYASKLAYRLFDTDGTPLAASLVPALLPEAPSGLAVASLPVNEEALGELLTRHFNLQDEPQHGRLCIVFAVVIPETLLGRLQVSLRTLAMIGGAWRHGCALHVDGSYSILYESPSGSNLNIVSAGANTAARSVIIAELVALIRRDFVSLAWTDVQLHVDKRILTLENMREEYPVLEYKKRGKVMSVDLRSLAVLIGVTPQDEEDVEEELAAAVEVRGATVVSDSPSSPATASQETLTVRDTTSSIMSTASVEFERSYRSLPRMSTFIPGSLLSLRRAIADRNQEDDDIVNLLDLLQDCIPALLAIMGVEHAAKQVRTLWIPLGKTASDAGGGQRGGEPEIRAIPLSPVGSRNGPWVFVEEAALVVSNTPQAQGGSDGLRNVLEEKKFLFIAGGHILKEALEVLEIFPPVGWEFIPLLELKAYYRELKTMQNRHFDQVDGRFIHIKYIPTAQSMSIARHAQSAEEGQLTIYSKIEALAAAVDRVEQRVTQILQLSEDLKRALSSGLEIIRNAIVNIHQRTFPTSFVVLDAEAVRGSSGASKGIISRMNNLYSLMSHPVDYIEKSLQEEMFIALICEVCGQPQTPPYQVTRAKSVVVKFLPLARVGLKIAVVANKLSGIGRVFGLPTPVLADETMDGMQAFVTRVSQDSLSDYPSLQYRVEQHFAPREGTPEGPGTDAPPAALGFCARAFGRFLREHDPKDTWGRLSKCLSEDEANVFFACIGCCTSNRVM